MHYALRDVCSPTLCSSIEEQAKRKGALSSTVHAVREHIVGHMLEILRASMEGGRKDRWEGRGGRQD